jgi:hypothetical protein
VTEPLVILVSVPVMGDMLQVTPLPDVSPFATAVMATELPASTRKVLLATVMVTVMFGGITFVEEPPPQPAMTVPTASATSEKAKHVECFTGPPCCPSWSAACNFLK